MARFQVPVVMFHSVADDRPDRPRPFTLYAGIREFESYLQHLSKRRWSSIRLQELHDWLAGGKPLPPRSIALTFDDGYLDNWVAVAPLLRKYGFAGTVFVPTDFIQPGEGTRPTLEDVWAGRARESELQWFGYLNRAEVRSLAQSGVLDVQSHARTHTWLPCSDEVVAFHRPGLPMRRYLRWMWWNRFPSRKPFWFHEIKHEDLPWGTPVFRNDLALAGRAFVPHPLLERRLVEHVAEQGGRELFERPGWHERLTSRVAAFRRDEGPLASPEDDAAFESRLRNEIAGSRITLEGITEKPVRFLCWPNGGVCDEAFRVAIDSGYLATTIPSRMARGGNRRGDPAHQIRRIGSTPYFHGTWTWPKRISFAMQVERASGNRVMNLPIKMIWLYRRFVPVRRPVEPEI
jgi:peptidoglycan/xylan/chitin deacetylase (PgdA/CDA1 family)